MPKLTKVAGFEWGTGFYINPTSPEEAARVLRDARVLTAGERRVQPVEANPAVWYFRHSLKGPSGNNSVVECDLAKVEVAGSNPVSRSNFHIDRCAHPPRVHSAHAVVGPSRSADEPPFSAHSLRQAPSPSGKAEVCKTSTPGSNPGGASKIH